MGAGPGGAVGRRLALAAVAVPCLVAAGFLVTRHTAAAPPPALVVATVASARSFPTRQPTPRDLAVYVSGAVATPGVYTLRPGSRAQDALAAAGGPLDDADLDHVNLAAPLSDGEQLAVPHQGEATPAATRTGRSAAGARGPTPTPQGVWLLNINSASAGDFRALPGIGQVTADHLVAYRQQNGPYASVDDLVKAGLHKTELARLRSRLTVQ
ncbi:MAG: SLBB domain-containing protein [Chloroflexota bacterium]